MKRILFMCVANACRSQMAEGFARALRLPDVEIYSAGSRPALSVHQMAVAVMDEIGIDIRRGRPKGVTDLPAVTFDLAVSLCGDMCPTAKAAERRSWNVPDPTFSSLAEVRRIRDQIRRRVDTLMQELAAAGPVPEPVKIVRKDR